MSTAAYDVVIAGGGIVGAACALECAKQKLRVALVEARTIGGGATAAGMGHVVVMDDSEAQFALTRYSQELWKELAAELPAEAEHEPAGTLWVAADDEEMGEVRRKRDYYSARGVPVEVLDGASLAAAEPGLRAGLAGALLVPEDSVVYAPCVTQFLAERARALGAEIHAGRRVTGMSDDGVKLSDGTALAGGAMVNAAGCAAPALIPELPVTPRKGHLLITDRYPGWVRHQLVELGYLKSAHASTADSVAFNVQPRHTGQVLIGSSRQYGSDSLALDHVILSRMLARAVEYMPPLGGLLALRAWTGFRAATADKLPLIGLCPGYRRVYAATGHEGLGITTSLATAKLLVDEISGRDSAIPRFPYRVERNQPAHV